MDKLIKLDDALEACSEAQGKSDSKGFLRGVSAVWSKIKKLQTVEPDEIPQWIPVSEKMPQNEDCVIVKARSNRLPQIARYMRDTFSGSSNEKVWKCNNGNYLHVIYWIPLPQPPRGEKQ